MITSAAPIILILGHYQEWLYLCHIQHFPLLKHLVYAYGQPYTDSVRQFVESRPYSRFRRDLYVELENWVEMRMYPSNLITDQYKVRVLYWM